MEKTLKFEKIISLVPLIMLSAYSIGFITFLFYFIDENITGKTNIFSYLTPNDHMVIFATGMVLVIFLFLPLILPSLIIQTSNIKEGKIKLIIKVILYLFLGYIFSFFVIALLQNKYSDNVLFLKAWVHIVIFIIVIGFIWLINKFFDSSENKKGNIVVIFLVFFILLVVFFETSIIKLSGYGNRWACLTLTAKEGESIIRNPEFKQFFKVSSDKTNYFTPKRVFIVLQLKDHIFIDNRTDNKNKKTKAIKVIPMSATHVFGVDNKSDGYKCVQ